MLMRLIFISNVRCFYNHKKKKKKCHKYNLANFNKKKYGRLRKSDAYNGKVTDSFQLCNIISRN